MAIKFYHGGVKGLKIGDLVLPMSATGKSNTRNYFTSEQIKAGHGLAHKVYVTSDLYAAKAYASTMPFGDVYLVEPLGVLQDDIDAPGVSFCCDYAKVISIVQRRVKFKLKNLEKMMSL